MLPFLFIMIFIEKNIKIMVTNCLDYMYEGYGYDMDNQLLYTSVEKYEEALTEETKMSTNGMEGFAYQGILGYDKPLEVAEANEYKKEIGQFISENGANYTDLRQSVCT